MSIKHRLNPQDLVERAMLDDDLNQMRHEVIVEITSTNQRTSPQNRFYHGVIVRYFADFLRKQGQPWTTEMCHRALASKFLTVSEHVGDQFVETVRSTADLTVEEFGEYIDNCCVWLLEQFDIVVPMPSDMTISAV